MKKLLILLAVLMTCVVHAWSQGSSRDDFDTFNNGSSNTKYSTYYTHDTSKWTATYAQIINSSYVTGTGAKLAPYLNGKSGNKGVITSPTLSGGIGTLKFYYGSSSDTKAALKIEILQNNTVVKTESFSVTGLTTNKAYNDKSFTFDVEGNFVIRITNASTSTASSNTDRVAVWDLEWTGFNNNTVYDPVFSPADGSTVDLTQDITLSCKTPDATIMYALDGSTTYSEYTASTKINFSTTGEHSISAYATKNGMTDSQTVTATYNVVDLSNTCKVAYVADGYKDYSENNTTYTLSDTDLTSSTYSIDNVCSVKFDKNGATNAPTVSDGMVRWYQSSLIKVTPADGVVITGIKFSTSSKYGKITIGDNTITTSADSKDADFTGLAYTEEFKISNNAQIRFYYMEVTYVPANDTPETPALGDVKGSLPDGSEIEAEESYTITVGDKLTFSAENATKILVRYTDGDEITEGVEFNAETYTLTWTPEAMVYKDITVVASVGDGDNATQKSLSFTLNVELPLLGNITISYPKEFKGDNDDYMISVMAGTPLTFASENATSITLCYDGGDDDVDSEGGSLVEVTLEDGNFVWSVPAGFKNGVEVTASAEGYQSVTLHTSIHGMDAVTPEKPEYDYDSTELYTLIMPTDGTVLKIKIEATTNTDESSSAAAPRRSNISAADYADWTTVGSEFEFSNSDFDYTTGVEAYTVYAKSVTPTEESEVLALKVSQNTVSGIENVVADRANGEAVYYNLQGQRVANPVAGLYIRVQGNRAEKVVL
jgi:hypothetical protein